jgi:hypothetical protein
MKRLAFGVLALVLSGAAHAAALSSFEFKGMKATDMRSQHEGMWKKCEKYFSAWGCDLKDSQVGGVLAFPQVGWDDQGHMVWMRGTVSASSYSTLKEAFTTKWDSPIRVVQSAQNGFGAKIDVETLVWKFSEGNLTLNSPGFSRSSEWAWHSNAYQAYLDNLHKPKQDF